MKRLSKKDKNKTVRFRKGVASFYVVAFSTLLLVIIAASFAAIIISEIARTSNDDLAQSAYDSALAGVEDAKVAYYNYRNCLNQGAVRANGVDYADGLDCKEIIYLVEKEGNDCDVVAHILGRKIESVDEQGNEGVVVSETTNQNNMKQAYTCVKLANQLKDYRTTLTSSTQTRVLQVKLEDGVSANDINSVKISWYADSSNHTPNYGNFNNENVVFSPFTSGTPVPPTIALTLIQTSKTFYFSDFDLSKGDRTDRGTLYLVPIGKKEKASISKPGNYYGTYNGTKNYITPAQVVATNDKVAKDSNNKSKYLPFGVYCSDESDMYCTVEIGLPKPVGDGVRNDNTFMFAISLPYGAKYDTQIAMTFCKSATECVSSQVLGGGEEETNIVSLKGMQVGVDSTGRANDLFKRVEVRLDTGGNAMPYPLYGIQLLGNKNDNLLKKNLTVTCEWNFKVGNLGC